MMTTGGRHIRLEVSAMLTRNRDARRVAGESFLVIRPVGTSDAAAMLSPEQRRSAL